MQFFVCWCVQHEFQLFDKRMVYDEPAQRKWWPLFNSFRKMSEYNSFSILLVCLPVFCVCSEHYCRRTASRWRDYATNYSMLSNRIVWVCVCCVPCWYSPSIDGVDVAVASVMSDVCSMFAVSRVSRHRPRLKNLLLFFFVCFVSRWIYNWMLCERIILAFIYVEL